MTTATTTTRPVRLMRLLLPGLGALALVTPASSLAGEAGPVTAPAPAGPPSETAVPAPGGESPGASGGAAQTAPAGSAVAQAAPAPSVEGPPPNPRVSAQHPQRKTRGRASPAATAGGHGGSPAAPGRPGPSGGARAGAPAPSPTLLTPALTPGLESLISGVPNFFIESFAVPPFLLPIYQAAGTAYGVPWQVLAAINEVETDYGRDLSVSSAGAEGWMQFLPGEWAQYGVDTNGAGYRDPYNPADAIFAAARYLRAAGATRNIKAAVYAYNHSQAYVDSVMLRAQLLGGTPAQLLAAITGLTEARFPVHAAAHFSDGFPTSPATGRTLVGTTIYSQAQAPVTAVADGEVVRIGRSPSLGRYVSLRDAYGNVYTYAELGQLATLYPVLVPHVRSRRRPRISLPARERPPTGPATAGAQPRSPVSQAAVVSGLALGAAAGFEAAPAPTKPAARVPSARPGVRVFKEGSEQVYLHPLVPGVQVIAGTILGHVGATGTSAGGEGSPHIVFQIRPAGAGGPLIDPKPILDGWVALGNTSIFRAKGENPFLAATPTVGQVLLESKQQLEPQVLHDGGIGLGECARRAVESGRVDKRLLAALEYLSVSGLRPTVAGLKCDLAAQAAAAANAPAGADSESLRITAVNGVPILAHQGSGSIADTTVRRLLMLQGVNRPRRIASLMSYPGVAIATASARAKDAIGISFRSPAEVAHGAALADTVLEPSQWIRLVARLGEIPDPTVAAGPSPAAIPDASSNPGEGER